MQMYLYVCVQSNACSECAIKRFWKSHKYSSVQNLPSKNGCLLTLICVWVILLLRIVIIFTTCQGWLSMGLHDCFVETFIAVYFSKKHILDAFRGSFKGWKIPIFMWIYINWVALNKMNIKADSLTQLDYSWNTKHCKLVYMNIVIDDAFIVLSFTLKLNWIQWSCMLLTNKFHTVEKQYKKQLYLVEWVRSPLLL